MSKTSLLFMALFLSLNALVLKMKDEDHIFVHLGEQKRELTLIIDPMCPFTYIFDPNSEAPKADENIIKFENIFGEFQGIWKRDKLFLSEDNNVNFDFKYLKVFSKNSKLQADGVLGLGYSNYTRYQESSIYYQLGFMSQIFKAELAMTYDRKNKLLTIGEIAPKSDVQPFEFPFYYEDEAGEDQNGIMEQSIYLSLTKISVRSYTEGYKFYLELNDKVQLGLLPTIIAPKSRTDWLKSTYFPHVNQENAQISIENVPYKFFSDIYVDKVVEGLDAHLSFGDIGYQFEYFEKKDGRYRRGIKIAEHSKGIYDRWYVGLDTINVDRADFFFDRNVIKLYSAKVIDIYNDRATFLGKFLLFCIAVCIVLAIFLRTFCQKPKVEEECKNEEELIDKI